MESKRIAGTLLMMCSAIVGGCSSQVKTGPGVVDADAPTEFTQTDSGLQYRILRKSDGPRPQPSDTVRVDYTGWLDDGSVFDTSYEKRSAETFLLNSVVPGWTEGMQLVGVGGMIELIIPPELGYGKNGFGSRVPPDATLHFKVELLAIE